MADCSKTEVFLKELKRMCCTNDYICSKCNIFLNSNNGRCSSFIKNNPLTAVEIVQKWSDENPIKTRQSDFLKLFPNAELRFGMYVDICPQRLNKNFVCKENQNCNDCEAEFWLAEVE